MDKDFNVEIIIFVISIICWIIKGIYDYISKYVSRDEQYSEEEVYSPQDFDRPQTLEEMIRRGMIEVVNDSPQKEEPQYVAEEINNDYVENLNAFAENLQDDMTYARNEAPVCEVEELDYEENVLDVDYADFIRQNGKASIIIAEILLPANSKMRK